MDSPVGKIVSIRHGCATVTVDKTAACPRCAAGKGCGAGLFSGSSRSALLEIPLAPHSSFQEGDEVRLALEPSHLLRATLLVYGLPLAGIVLMLGIGWLISKPLTDSGAIAYAIVGLAAGLLAGRRQLNRRECLRQFVPTIEGQANVDR